MVSSSSRPPPPGFYSTQGQPPPPPPPPPPPHYQVSQYAHHGHYPTQQHQNQQQYHTPLATSYGAVPPPPPPPSHPGYGYGTALNSFQAYPNQQHNPTQYHHQSYPVEYGQQQGYQPYQQLSTHPYGVFVATTTVPGSAPVQGAVPGLGSYPGNHDNSQSNQNSKRKRPRPNQKQQQEQNQQQRQRREKQPQNNGASKNKSRTKSNHLNVDHNEDKDESSSDASSYANDSTKKSKTSVTVDTSTTETNTTEKLTWTCTTCNVTVDSERAWKDHRKNHVKCTECDFEGCPKVVKGHYQAHHGKFSGSGFKTVTVNIPGCRVQRFKICVGNNPEDIKKWIAERKKRFPRFSSTLNKSSTTATSARPAAMDAKETSPSKTAGGVEGNPSRDSSISKGGHDEDKNVGGGLSSLLAGYGSSSEDEDSEKREDEDANVNSSITKQGTNEKGPNMDILGCNIINTPTDGTEKSSVAGLESPTAEIKTIRKRPCRFFFGRDRSCLHGVSCNFSHELPRTSPGQGQDDAEHQRHQTKSQTHRQQQNQQQSQQQHKQTNNKRRGHPTTSDTLLRKLLMPDMERESHLSFQLLKYIYDSKFFDGDNGNSDNSNGNEAGENNVDQNGRNRETKKA